MSAELKNRLLKEMKSAEKTKDFPFDLIIKLAAKSATEQGALVLDGVDSEIIDCAVAYYDAKDAIQMQRDELSRLLGRSLK